MDVSNKGVVLMELPVDTRENCESMAVEFTANSFFFEPNKYKWDTTCEDRSILDSLETDMSKPKEAW